MPRYSILNKNMRYAALTLILLLAVYLRLAISDFTPIMLDYDAFYHARIAEYIYQGHHIPTWDLKELGGIPHYYPPLYHIMIVVGKYLAPRWDAIAIGSALTVFFGVVATLFVYLIGRRFGEGTGLTCAFIYALTPMMVLRSGLWARPTGMTMLFAIMAVYLFLKVSEEKDWRYPALSLILFAAYTFTHSSVLFILPLLFLVSLITKDRYSTATLSRIAIFLLVVGGAYYYRALPHLNFSVASSGEYLPLIHPLRQLYPFSDLYALTAALLFLGAFNLAYFPLILHGSHVMYGRHMQLGILAIFSLFVIFFKANMFMLLNFLVCIAIAVSILRIYGIAANGGRRIAGAYVATLLLLTIVATSAWTIQGSSGEKKEPHVDVLRELLTDAPLGPDNLVLASNPNTGHGIAYYSQAGTFMSDLTDTKQYDKNLEVFRRLMDDRTSPDDAMHLLAENNIDHVLIIDDREFPFMEDSKQNFVLVKKAAKNGVDAHLYKLK